MKMYLAKVKGVIARFHSVALPHILRLDNAKADAFSRLASFVVSNEWRSIVWKVLPTSSINVFVGGVNTIDS